MSEHTKEPWSINKYGTVIAGGHTLIVTGIGISTGRLDTIAGANARRIVACVNALSHISTEELETGNMQNLIIRMRDAEQQRDELLASNKELIEAMIRYEMDVETEAPNAHREMMKRAKDAIAKATA